MQQKQVVVVGCGPAGLASAIEAAQAGARVTIVDENARPGGQLFKQIHKFFGSREHYAGTRGFEIGAEMLDFRLGLTLGWFERKGVSVITGVKALEVTAAGIDYVTGDGKKQTVTADTIIPTRPLVPNLELFTSLKGKIPEVYAIGDCRQPRKIVNAIADAYEIARML